jgi:2-methylisocitrate lyase-like PEP mutase family enzyme
MYSQADKAMQFRERHRGPGVLVLPNAWDVASARIFEDANFPAIATTSAGIAFRSDIPMASAFRGMRCLPVSRVSPAP